MSSFKVFIHALVWGTLVGLSACRVLEADTLAERTYPEAGDLPQISLEALRKTADMPGAYNVQVYVIGINICPDGYRCFIPDGITVAESKTPDLPEGGLHLAVDEPEQFQIQQRYVMSIEAEPAGWNHPETGEPIRSMRLLGYSLSE
jgi:hypothetical protein